jgi:hypothetical protein
MVCLRNISVDTLHKGDTKNDDDDDKFLTVTTLTALSMRSSRNVQT